MVVFRYLIHKTDDALLLTKKVHAKKI